MDVRDVFQEKIPQGAKVLYFFLKAYPGVYSQTELAVNTGTTTQSINAYVKLLKKMDWIETQATSGSRRFFYDGK